MHARADQTEETVREERDFSAEQNLEMACWFREVLAGNRSFLEQLTLNDWLRFIDFSRKNGIAPVLYHVIKDSPPGGISENFIHLLRNIYLGSAHRNLVLYHELGKVLKLLQAEDIPVILLKGSCLSGTVYENIALRCMGDVDLLVKQIDMTKVLQVLSHLGYSAGYDFSIANENAVCHHLPPLTNSKNLTIEVHWNIVDCNHFYVLAENEIEDLWIRAKPIVIAEAHASILSPEDLLLHLCLHLSVLHLFDMRLRGFLDLRKVIEHYGDVIDWALLRERARRWRVERAVRLTLDLAERWVGLKLPGQLKHNWRVDRIDPHLLNWIEASVLGEAIPYSSKPNLTDLIVCRSIPAKVSVLWRRLFLPTTALSRQFKVDANSWQVYLYYPIGWVSLLKRCGPIVWSALSGDAKVKSTAQRENALRQWLAES